MSEDGEIWAEIKADRQAKKEENRIQSMALLEEKGIEVLVLSENNGHCRIGDYDFWPTTGKFINRKTQQAGRGVFSLLKKLNGK